MAWDLSGSSEKKTHWNDSICLHKTSETMLVISIIFWSFDIFFRWGRMRMAVAFSLPSSLSFEFCSFSFTQFCWLYFFLLWFFSQYYVHVYKLKKCTRRIWAYFIGLACAFFFLLLLKLFTFVFNKKKLLTLSHSGLLFSFLLFCLFW